MSVLLDTNVLSELLRPRPEASVLAWFAGRAGQDDAISSVTQAEMSLGARLLPAGKRRQQLEQALRLMFEEDFAGRVWPFDAEAAVAYADIVAKRRTLGRPISQFDAQIAAIARARHASIATRNIGDFADCGVTLIDPWRS